MIPFAILAFCLIRADSPLRSPWDLWPVKLTDVAYAAHIPAPLAQDITAFDYYSDAKHSVIDPVRFAAYNAAAKTFQETMREVENAADRYRATGSRSAAETALQILAQNARAGAMTGKMSANQAHYVQNWTLSALAITYLKVRSANVGTPEDRRLIASWLKLVAGSVQAYFDMGRAKGAGDTKNNHYSWGGIALIAAGVADDDRAMFDWGLAAYDDQIARIQPDGTLPLEMARGKRALHYHVFALAPMVMLAEFGAANGLDLYARGGGALARLVDRTMSGLQDNSYFAERSGVAQDTPADGKIKSEDIIYITPFLRRFPNPNFARLLKATELRPYVYLGGLPPP